MYGAKQLSERLVDTIVPLPAIYLVLRHFDYKGRKKNEIIHCFSEKLFVIFVPMYKTTQHTNWWWHSTNRWCAWR